MTDMELMALVKSYTKDIEICKKRISCRKSDIEHLHSMIKHYKDQRNALWLEALVRFVSRPFGVKHG
jgi:hypothetical protein